ncbi:GNAT family N-acetyltransferase [Arthrobacter sp. Sa2BUA2]|uniref:GNAT family N-acetyltransferase n=1 Tax=Arthrobacter pullicola TaxID=2762224 RepID=A0ABR8YLZ8_9MICC|nr:GNAT family N-acetyltransferase [Arthrobacter pullicola]MBD8044934.1 GNAT family N-acetyltransferase [Arthrobacter pullicola]
MNADARVPREPDGPKQWSFEVHPATVDRFDDLTAILSPQNPAAAACWCLSYRIPPQEFRALTGEERPARLRRYAEDGVPPGVIAYVDGEPAGWCSVSPRASHSRLAHSQTIPAVDDVPAWSVVCLVIRPEFRRRGMAHQLLGGAVSYARSQGAPVLEAYPIDPQGERISAAFAYTGTTELFEAAGFQRIVPTTSTSGGKMRWLMQLSLD